MDSQALGIVATIIINSVAIAWTIRETFVRHGQTKELQESNARLQNEVHRLSVHLNQEIVRLNRLNSLARGMYVSGARLHFKYALLTPNEYSDSGSSDERIYSPDEVVDFFTTVESSIVEMRAIARVIGDSDLISLIDNLRVGISPNSMKESNDDFIQSIIDFGHHASALHEKVYQLLETATSTANAGGHKKDSKGEKD